MPAVSHGESPAPSANQRPDGLDRRAGRAQVQSEAEGSGSANAFHSAGQRQTRSGCLCPTGIVSRP
jgi:hypothetical protein